MPPPMLISVGSRRIARSAATHPSPSSQSEWLADAAAISSSFGTAEEKQRWKGGLLFMLPILAATHRYATTSPLRSTASTSRLRTRYAPSWRSHPASPERLQRRCYASASDTYSAPSVPAVASIEDGDADDWSTIEVEVLTAEQMEPADGSLSGLGLPPAASRFHGTTAEVDAVAASSSSPMSTPPGSGGGVVRASVAMQTIETVDPYAKAKVGNFIRRLQQPSAGRDTSGAAVDRDSSATAASPAMEVRQVQGCGAHVQYHARWRLPLPHEFGERYGEGYAATPKEAEAVAAMHAERVIDALGFPLFLLPSKQRKHAEAARAAGRWAPMPASNVSSDGSANPSSPSAEVVPSPDTASPPPLQLLSLTARQEQARQLQIDRVRFSPVYRDGLSPLPNALRSANCFDAGSRRRVENFLRSHRTTLRKSLRLVLLRGATPSDVSNLETPDSKYLAQLTLPLPVRFGKRIAMGKAVTRRDAVLLACMHAELIIDAVGLALYPQRRDHQAAHARECAMVGRWCAQPGDCTYRYAAPSPPPLELARPFNASASETGAGSTGVGHTTADQELSQGISPTGEHGCTAVKSGVGEACYPGSRGFNAAESLLEQHHRAVRAVHTFVEENSLREYETGRVLLDRYLEQFVPPLPPSDDPAVTQAAEPNSLRTTLMIIETLGQRDRPIFRATFTVPLADDAAAYSATTGHSPIPYQTSFVAIGVSDSALHAEVAASLHALRVLAALNRLTLVRSNGAVLQALDSFAARSQLPRFSEASPMLSCSQLLPEQMPPPVRSMEGFVGRIASSGLDLGRCGRSRLKMLPGEVDERKRHTIPVLSFQGSRAMQLLNREDHLLRELRHVQEQLPRLDWDLTADAEGRIIVAPDFDPTAGRMYNHTLASVRHPDKTALIRLRDYLERHGKTLEMALSVVRTCHTAVSAVDGSYYVATVMLPIVPRGGGRTRRPQHATQLRCDTTAAKDVEMPPTPPAPTEPQQSQGYTVAQGEAPTKDEAILLCAAHAELLLDAIGQLLYDHPVLQRKHADVARSLGRWAPLGRGAALPPPALNHIPPPLRQVRSNSALWAQVQEQRHRFQSQREESEEIQSLNAHVPEQPPSVAPNSSKGEEVPRGNSSSDDEKLCDLALMQFVHHTEIEERKEWICRSFFTERGSDFRRVVRQYAIWVPVHGMMHRSIVELPISALFGKRYAVGCAPTKKQSINLCIQHAFMVLEKLQIPVFSNAHAQRKYVAMAAAKGRIAPLFGSPLAPYDTPSPPGLYYTLRDPAKTQPSAIPELPRAQDLKNEMFWASFVQSCVSHVRRRREVLIAKAVCGSPKAQAPRYGLLAEDVTLDMAEELPADRFARRRLKEVIRAAGLPEFDEACSAEALSPSLTDRRYFVAVPLPGTPYEMRGASTTAPVESRIRAYEHGIRLCLHVVRPNMAITKMLRLGWWDGVGRGLSNHEPLQGQPTPHGCQWVMRVWASMHYPPRCLRVMLSKTETLSKHTLAHGDSDALEMTAPTEGKSSTADTKVPATMSSVSEDHYQVTTSIVERTAGRERVLHRSFHDAPSHDAVDVVHAALRQLFNDLQRTPTMMSLCRFLTHEPQLHLPSFRVLKDREDIVNQMHGRLRLSREAAPHTPTAQLCPSCLPKYVRSFLDLQTSFYAPWSVRMLLQWVDAYRTTEEPPHDGGAFHLPHTLVSSFADYGLVRNVPLRQLSSVVHQKGLRDARSLQPTQLADALALLARCLPQLPAAENCTNADNNGDGATIPPATATNVGTGLRGRMLPLQLTHVILMGLLLGCGQWAVRVAAMVACAEETLAWYDRCIAKSTGCTTKEGSMGPLTSLGRGQRIPFVSVDVVEAALESLDSANPPLPEPVLKYATEIEKRLCMLSSSVSAAERSDGKQSVLWLRDVHTWRKNDNNVSDEKWTPAPPLPLLSVAERRALRPLLQCAVVTSTAPHSVWVRVREMEREVVDERALAYGDDICQQEDTSRMRLVFQGRRHARYAALYVGTSDLTQPDSVLSAKDISDMVACFTTFDCEVTAVPSTTASLPTEGNHEDELHPSSAPVVDANASNVVAREKIVDDNDDGDGNTDEEDEDDDVALFTRVFGTCASPLASALVGVGVTTSMPLPRRAEMTGPPDGMEFASALQAAGENLPAMMTAFQGLLPLLIHRHSLVIPLTEISAYLRSRVVQTIPFSKTEREAVSLLVTLPVHGMEEDDVQGTLADE